MEGQEVTVRDVRDVGSDTIAVTLESPPSFKARPGQFVQVGLQVDDEYVVRHYTISSPYVEDTFEVTVEIDREGSLSPRLAEMQPGSTVDVDGPYGRVYLEEQDSLTVLAGGPGVGPAIAIAERLVEDGGTSAIVYRDDEPVHRDRLGRLRENGVPVYVLDENDDVTDAVKESLQEVDGEVFIYGFSDFVGDALDALEEAGVDDDKVKVERFD